MKSVLWRPAEAYGVVYTEDREHLRRLLMLEKFPVKREEDAVTYKNARGRVFAWQATFDLSLWNRVVRTLGREEIDIQLDREPRARKAGLANPATVPAASPQRSHPATASPGSRSAAPSAPPARRSEAPAAKPRAPVPPATGAAARRSSPPDLPSAPASRAGKRKTALASETPTAPTTRKTSAAGVVAPPQKKRGRPASPETPSLKPGRRAADPPAALAKASPAPMPGKSRKSSVAPAAMSEVEKIQRGQNGVRPPKTAELSPTPTTRSRGKPASQGVSVTPAAAADRPTERRPRATKAAVPPSTPPVVVKGSARLAGSRDVGQQKSATAVGTRGTPFPTKSAKGTSAPAQVGISTPSTSGRERAKDREAQPALALNLPAPPPQTPRETAASPRPTRSSPKPSPLKATNHRPLAPSISRRAPVPEPNLAAPRSRRPAKEK